MTPEEKRKAINEYNNAYNKRKINCPFCDIEMTYGGFHSHHKRACKKNYKYRLTYITNILNNKNNLQFLEDHCIEKNHIKHFEKELEIIKKHLEIPL